MKPKSPDKVSGGLVGHSLQDALYVIDPSSPISKDGPSCKVHAVLGGRATHPA